jgi:hypothetical protein
MSKSSILKSTPARPAKFPPPLPARKQRVKTGDSWFTMAAQHGRTDPWDLIEFNFRTREPREVNWYLEYYVGCSKSSDGKNYSFDSTDTPGIVYIPPASWTPSTDLALRRLVVEALSGPVINRVSVSHSGHTITGRSLAAVANRVIDREIGVVVDSTAGSGEAEYDSGSDTFHLGFSSAASRTRKALIVHEAVHAALDMQTASSITIAQSESLAYVVQCFYVREYTPDPDAERLTSSNPLKDKVYEIAWDMAATLAKRRQPEPIYWSALDSAIRRHPTYKKNAGKKAGFDGI